MKISFLILSLLTFFVFTVFSYSVAKEAWQRIDFDSTVRLQDHLSRKFDSYFSYFSLLGSVEITIGVALLMSLLSLLRKRFLAALAWLIILPASFFEVFGKLVIFHPAPPVLFHRNVLEANLPSFYIHTNFSYPSGHMTRTIFLVTVFLLMILLSKKKHLKLISSLLLFGLAFMMTLTRVYLGEHWLSDVLGGGLLGLSSGLFASIFVTNKKYVSIK